MLSGSSERKSSIFPSVASFTHWLMFARSSSCFPVSFTGFAPKSRSDCSRKSSLMGNPAHNRPQAHPRAGASNSHLCSTCLPKAKPPSFPLVHWWQNSSRATDCHHHLPFRRYILAASRIVPGPRFWQRWLSRWGRQEPVFTCNTSSKLCSVWFRAPEEDQVG